MPSPNYENHEEELKSICENVKNTKNTCMLYNLQSTIEKFLDEKRIQNRELILECLNQLNNIIPSKLLENLLKKAIELNDTQMCHCIIRNVQILEEYQAVDCLRYFLKDESIESNQLEVEKHMSILLVKKFDYRLLTSELKRLSSNQFITCLQYLQNHLKISFRNKSNSLSTSQTEEREEPDTKMLTDCVENETNGSELSSSKPSILQVVELFCCLVDAHFTHITLSTKAQEIIADVLQLIETQLDLFMDLISIESLIKEAKHNSEFKIKSNNNIGHYYIEVLKLV